ncbi:Gfo/Idh/MocA family protein [Cesiribacter sp. SM1]|uniref:Gfo/Idh/MocA family protein n=1 Tax=Cesiribacter sp. SM1 TaxID=2861196 RepID=UPI001CD7D02C|nr:Gfo/Idh/MocA family oxidoreductase [Cesiribacter sp. SM1]
MIDATSIKVKEPFNKKTDKPRLGFLGVGWIGRNRMEALVNGELAEVAGILEPGAENREAALSVAPRAQVYESYEAMLDADLDGIVIASPSALHAEQSIAALNKGKAVFCQKPLGRNAAETAAVVAAARENNLLLGVDLCYRYTCFRQLYDIIQSGELGHIYAAELVFHNAWGPDKEWFYNPKLSGGGCVVDLGIHLMDLVHWSLNDPEVVSVNSNLFSKGQPLTRPDEQVEDYANALIKLKQQGGGETSLQLICSWNLPAGQEADIQANFYGTNGGVAFRNMGGSFYDFKALRFNRTQTEVLFQGPDDWGGRPVSDWARRLAAGEKFNAESETIVAVAKTLDRIYGRI